MRPTCLWWEDAPLSGPPASAPLPPAVDVAVIGGGYTGLSAARTLARGGARVVVLEQEAIGWGASSRNAGQVLTGLKLGIGTLVARFGPQRARELFRTSIDAMDSLEGLIAEEGIDCGFARCGHVEAAFKPAHFEAFRREQELLDRLVGHPVELLARADQRSELGSDFYHGVLVDERSAALHPARYVLGLAEAARRAGADLRPLTPVQAIAARADGLELATPRGAIRARDVLVATNGYTGAAVPALRRRVVPVGSFLLATAPLAPAVAAALLPRGRTAFDSKNFLFYFRLTPDRRLLFGGRAHFGPATPEGTRRAGDILRRGMVQVFPELRDVAIDFAWSGNVCVIPDRLPRSGRLGGLHYALGYSGHGIALATFLGDRVARRMLGEAGVDDPFWGQPFAAIPLYDGRPWFLPLAGMYYRLRDWMA
ncbi:MAG TPA: FAD-binding oxidoreductase [Vicinamibacteria bacterium]|nr:FAD-binding oxidoreductase [Vicinamibacteria bacterium]